MKIIAHRGASGDFPENTLQAFEQAILQNADGIELDAQYHQASGQFILLHDSYVFSSSANPTLINVGNEKAELHSTKQKLPKQTEYHFNQLSLDELLSTYIEGQPLTTLDKALSTINGRCLVNIELKAATTKPKEVKKIVTALIKLLASFCQKKIFDDSQFIISAFNHHLLQAIKRNSPHLRTAALIASCPTDYSTSAKKLLAFSINPAIDCLNAELINHAHENGQEVWVYTVDRPQQIEQCLTLGVDAIFTNFPARSRKLLTKDKS